jgi:hypothetical protein
MLFLLLVKASNHSEKANLPNPKLMKLMDEYNDNLINAGVRVMAKGLHPSSEGMRIIFDKPDQKPIVQHGPFVPVQDVIAGFFLLEVKTKEEAIYWANQAPDPQGNGEGAYELRQVY